MELSLFFSENRVIDGLEFEGLEYVFTADGKLIGKFGKSNIVKVANSDEYSQYLNNYLTLEELALCTQNISTTSDDIKSNIYTTIYYKEVRDKNTKYKLVGDKIGINETNNAIPKEIISPIAEAQTYIRKENNSAAISVWSTNNDNYWDIASTLNHEHGHAYLELDKKVFDTSGRYETLVYWFEIDNDIFEKSTEISQLKTRNLFTQYLSKLAHNNFTEEAQKYDAKLFKKYKSLYEKKFNNKWSIFPGSQGVFRIIDDSINKRKKQIEEEEKEKADN